MNDHVTITATVAAWTHKGYSHSSLLQAMERKDYQDAVDYMCFYGAPSLEKFSDYLRVGEADITVRLLPKDEQTRIAVQALRDQLDEERAKWLEKQQQIMDEINKLQALTFDESSTGSEMKEKWDE